MKTHTTSDYSIFRYLPENRDIKRKHVTRLVLSLARSNKLHTNPIIINSDYYVVDGQHRLEACKQAGIPVCYTIDDDYTDDDLLCKQVHEKWNVRDRINYHANCNPQWQEVKELIEATQLSTENVLALIGYTGRAKTKKLEEGGALTESEEELNAAKQMCYQVAEILKWLQANTSFRSQRFYRSWKFVSALAKLIKKADDFDAVFHKIQVNWRDITIQPDTRKYELMLQELYNKRMKRKVKL